MEPVVTIYDRLPKLGYSKNFDYENTLYGTTC